MEVIRWSNSPTEISPLALIKAIYPNWLDLHHRYLRSIVSIDNRQTCGDPELDLKYHVINKDMDDLLLSYYDELQNAGKGSE